MSSWNNGGDPPQDPQDPQQFGPPQNPQQYGAPQNPQQFGPPNQYGPPNPQQYGPPNQQYGPPNQQYGAPQYPQGGNWPGAAPPYGYQGPPQTQGMNGLAIAGFVCAFLCSIVGLVLSIVGYNQCKQRNQSGAGLALAGIIISVLSVLLEIGVVASR